MVAGSTSCGTALIRRRLFYKNLPTLRWSA